MSKSKRFSLTFTVNNFSQIKKEVSSPPIIAHNLKWRILITPKYDGQEGQQTKSLGYYLYCDGPDGGSPASSWSCQATVDLRVISLKKVDYSASKQFSHLYTSKADRWGYKAYLKWADVESTKRGLIEADSVTFLALVAADEPQRCRRCEERDCKVCMKEEVCILFDPCGHLATCTKCSSNLNECPICRGKINKKTRAFV